MRRCEYDEVGSFSLSGKAVITDPCYLSDIEGASHCTTRVDVRPGVWKAYAVLENGGNVMCLAAKFMQSGNLDNMTWEEVGGCGVDSGQGCIHDATHCVNGDFEDFFERCGNISMDNEVAAGYLDHTAVSSSGVGDGYYPVEVSKNRAGEVIAIRVIYLDLEEGEQCQECGHDFDPDDLEDGLCADCQGVECESCGDWFEWNEGTTNTDGEFVCNGCHDWREEQQEEDEEEEGD